MTASKRTGGRVLGCLFTCLFLTFCMVPGIAVGQESSPGEGGLTVSEAERKFLARQELSEEKKRKLLEAIRSGQKSRAIMALRELARYGPAGKPVILEALDMDDPAILGPLTTLVGDFGIEEAVPRLIELIEAEDIFVSKGAVGALGRMKAGQASQVLVDTLRRTTSVSLKTSLVIALGDLGNESAIPLLEEVLTDEDAGKYLRLHAAGSLGRLNSQLGLSLAREALLAEDTSTQFIAIQAVASLRDSDSLASLERITEEPGNINKDRAHIAVREIVLADKTDEEKLVVLKEDIMKDVKNVQISSWAARRLADIGSPEAVEILKEAYRASDRRKRENMVMQLYRLGIDPEGE